MRIDTTFQQRSCELSRRSANVGEVVCGEIRRGLPSEDLTRLESQWSTMRGTLSLGVEHGHWNWENKIDRVQSAYHMLISLSGDDLIQGIVAVKTETIASRIDSQSLIYIDYVETAPWNLEMAHSPVRYLGVGTTLIREVVHLSNEQGMQGRIGLHSLPQALNFYLNRGMTDLGEDPNYADLHYLEYNVEKAQTLINFTEDRS